MEKQEHVVLAIDVAAGTIIMTLVSNLVGDHGLGVGECLVAFFVGALDLAWTHAHDGDVW
jgi:hypothetical protein